MKTTTNQIDTPQSRSYLMVIMLYQKYILIYKSILQFKLLRIQLNLFSIFFMLFFYKIIHVSCKINSCNSRDNIHTQIATEIKHQNLIDFSFKHPPTPSAPNTPLQTSTMAVVCHTFRSSSCIINLYCEIETYSFPLIVIIDKIFVPFES